MQKLLCKCHEGRAGFFSLVTVPSKASCSQRERSRTVCFQKSSDLGKEKGQCLSLVASAAQAIPGGQSREVQWKKDGSRRRSWPQTVSPDGISAGGTQQQLSSERWLRFSGPTLRLAGEMNQKGIEDRWCKQKGKEMGWAEAKERSWYRVTV